MNTDTRETLKPEAVELNEFLRQITCEQMAAASRAVGRSVDAYLASRESRLYAVAVAMCKPEDRPELVVEWVHNAFCTGANVGAQTAMGGTEAIMKAAIGKLQRR